MPMIYLTPAEADHVLDAVSSATELLRAAVPPPTDRYSPADRVEARAVALRRVRVLGLLERLVRESLVDNTHHDNPPRRALPARS